MKKTLLLTSITLSIMVIALLATCTGVFAANATPFEQMGQSENFGYGDNPIDLANSDIESIASHFSIAADATIVAVGCPSWNDSVGDMTLTLYKFNSSYEESIKGTPIATHEFEGFQDNAFIGFSFGASDPLPAGEYVLRITDVTDSSGSGAGIWAGATYPGQNFYQDDEYDPSKSFKMTVSFVTPPSGDPYGTLSSPDIKEVPINKIPHPQYILDFKDEEAIDTFLTGVSHGNNGIREFEYTGEALKVHLNACEDPNFYISIPDWIADDYLYTQDAGAMLIKLRLPEGAPREGEIFFNTTSFSGPTAGGSVVTQYSSGTDWQYVIFDLESNKKYAIEDAEVIFFRYDIFLNLPTETYAEIEYILFFDNYESALTWEGDFTIIPTPEPTPVPTPSPEPTATPEATEAPETTPEPTKVPDENKDDQDKEPGDNKNDSNEKGNNTVIIIVVVAAIAVIITIAILILLKKKK